MSLLWIWSRKLKLLREWLRRRRLLFCGVLAALFLVPVFSFIAVAGEAPAAMPEIAAAELPEQARETLALIRSGRPFPYERDGAVFGNFEKRLPLKERGYYREYTVKTPGARDRGARRIIAGRQGEYYYTGDHYASFKRIRE